MIIFGFPLSYFIPQGWVDWNNISVQKEREQQQQKQIKLTTFIITKKYEYQQ